MTLACEDGNRIRITHPDGVQFNYAWDGLDRLRAVNDNGPYQSVNDSILSKVYDPQGNVGLLLWATAPRRATPTTRSSAT